LRADSIEVGAQWRDEGCGQQREPILLSFAVADRESWGAQIDVANAEPAAFQQA
jgi:hypothetical protein